jgi:hypothetical protein
MSGIFISYRREDSSYIAGRLHDRLAAHFGAHRIFRDVDTMRPGVDFVQRIDEAVGSCDAFVAVIGDEWLSAVDAKGRRRLSNPKDWVRLEIAAALARDILVVPVLVENAKMPSESELPPALRKLARHNAMDLSDQRWDYEVDQLVRVLGEVVPPERPKPPPPPSPSPPTPPPRQERYGWEPHPRPAPAPGPSPGGARPWSSPAPAPSGSGVPTWVKFGAPGVLALVVVAVLVAALSGGSGSSSSPATTLPTTSPGPTTAPTTGPGGSAGPVFVGPFTATSGRITLTVEKVEATSNQLRFHVLVKNGTNDTIVLPAMEFSVVDDKGHSYKADPFSREWPRTLTPGETRGTVDVPEGLQPGATTLKVGWGTVFGTFEAGNGIFVKNVKVA